MRAKDNHPYMVKNWSEFQHYKNRTPPWVKLHRTLLDDIEYHKLDCLAAKCLPLVWLIASENDGRLPDLHELAFRLRITETQCRKVINALSPWVYQDASKMLVGCNQVATLETETETETETEKDGEKDGEKDVETKADKRHPLLSFGEFENVKLTESEYNKLCEKHGRKTADTGIDMVSAWLVNTKQKPKNHYACMNSNSWVWREMPAEAKSQATQNKRLTVR